MTLDHCLPAFRRRGLVQILSRIRPSRCTEVRSSPLKAWRSNTGTHSVFRYGLTGAACWLGQDSSALHTREFFLIGSTLTYVAGCCVISDFRGRECRCGTCFIPLTWPP